MSNPIIEGMMGTLKSPKVEEDAAIAVTVIFGALLIMAMINFRITHFRVYLLSGLSAAFRTIGFGCRAGFWAKGFDGNPNLQAAMLAFNGAGFGITIAVQTLVMGCWFKNADEGSKPTQPRPFPTLSIGVRLLIAPIIIFGPILGIATAVLIFGTSTPSAISNAIDLRKALTWGMWSCLILLVALESFAAFHAARGSSKSVRADPNKLVFVALLCALLMQLSSTFRVVGLFLPKFTANPTLYYSCVMLAELLELTIMSYPTLLARVAMAARYPEWQAAALGKGPVLVSPAMGASSKASDKAGSSEASVDDRV